MPQSPLIVHSLSTADLRSKIDLLINNLINITDKTGHFLLKLPDGRIIDTKGWHDWEWTHGVGLYGLYQYHSVTGLSEPLLAMRAWFAEQLARGTTKNINTMSPFLTLAYMYEDIVKSGKEEKSWRPWLESWADWAMHDLPRVPGGGMQHMTYLGPNTNELWDDTLMMTVLPLAKIGLVLGRPEYVEEAKRQFMIHCQYLFDPGSGLFFHGWKFEEKGGAVGHNFARARWARGNSWLTIAIPDFVELLDLPPTDGLRMFLLHILNAQVSTLTRLQDPKTGLWRTLLDVPESDGSYVESSATAGFAYGILKGVRKRYLDPKYEAVGIKAAKAVIGKISPEGELLDTSFGTGMGMNLQHYLDIERTSMPYGQAMAIMALVEMLRIFI
ncbi:glycosyl hydrolase [Rhizodiscina lignyota]|uniref:Glycosyl hydrolase n=1 Tax=Rhizodiscina lignyota TaxID=1504668 RepID=A0A9P4I870_9PEZI|nr:glycosyl hydrolase [Rhizodiscina lignyota]